MSNPDDLAGMSSVEMLEQARRLADAGEVEAAMTLSRKAVELSPDNDEILLQFSGIASAVGLLGDAVVATRRAVELNPNDSFNWLNHGHALFGAGDYASAIGAYEKASDGSPQVGALALCSIANTNVKLGRADLAVPAIRLAYQATGSDDVAREEVLDWASSIAEELLDRAELCVETGGIERALEIGRLAVQIAPYSSEAWFKFGILARSTGGFEEARRALIEARRLEPSSFEVWYSLANVHRSLGLLTEAIALFEHALLLEPNFVPAMNNLGLTLNELNRLDEGLSVLSRALKIAPDDADLHHNLAVSLMGLGDLEGAICELRSVLLGSPRNIPAMGRLAECLSLSGRNGEAREVAEEIEAIEKRVASPPIGLE